mgnify:CR=1 FL=1
MSSAAPPENAPGNVIVQFSMKDRLRAEAQRRHARGSLKQLSQFGQGVEDEPPAPLEPPPSTIPWPG